MSLRVAVLQCELSHPHTPPHLGPSLLVSELERRGHRVRRLFVNVTRLESLADELIEEATQLVAIDSIFPLDLVRRFKARLGGIPVVVGGLNAIPVFERAPLEFAILGPARTALAELVARIERRDEHREHRAWQAALEEVPNLFFREVRGDAPTVEDPIDASPRAEGWDVERELFPYAPPLEWEYRGPTGRHPMADRHGVSLIAEWGCPYQTPFPLPESCREDRVNLRPANYTDRAWARLVETYLDDSAACSFCIFRYQGFQAAPLARQIELLLPQVESLWAQGIRSFALQSESPFRLLGPLVEALVGAGMRPEELRLRTMVTVLRAQETAIEEALAAVAARGIAVSITQVGFESFVDRSLALFHKGVTSHDNRRAARFLRRIDRGGGGRIRTVHGHGLILFDPWTTLGELLENLEAIESDAPFLKKAVSLDSKLYLYSPYAPVARLVRAAGLLVESEYEFGLDYRFLDPEVERFRELCSRGLAPLLEAVGRRPLEPELRARLAIEARFRWFRELASSLLGESPSAGRHWGHVLAEVIRGLGLEG
ncbi:MAG: hypothetical protein U0527_02580 [Candidatus Eisenbacteria bacterium]